MPDRRIRIASDQAEFVKALLRTDESNGPFRTQADVLAFAAALGASRRRRRNFSRSAGEPVRQEVFERQNFVPAMNLVAIFATGDAKVLADTDEMEEARAVAFEQYASGGLEILEQELEGAVDYLAAILLMVASERRSEEGGNGDDLGLSKLLE